MDIIKNYTYKPIIYYSITILLTWISLFSAAYFSHTQGLEQYMVICMLPSLLLPFIVALFMIYGSKSKELKNDFKRRIFNLKTIKSNYWLAILLIMPMVVLFATAVSLLFGQSTEQFELSSSFQVMSGAAFLSVAILILAPTFEELGWRGYGVDSLLKGRSLLKASLLFALLWGLWHVPLFFIKGYYHFEILQKDPIFALNFFIALVPAAILSNWIFYKNGRSIIAIIIFHFILNLSSTLLQTAQFTKCIITIILLLISVWVFRKNNRFFMDKRTF